MLQNPKLSVCSWLYLTPSPPDFEALCVGALDALAMKWSETNSERSPLVLKGREGWGNSAPGPSPLLKGRELWELGWFQGPLKGREGPRSFKAKEAVPVFFQIPLMMGSVSLKTSVIQRRETFPRPREGGTSAQSPG